MRATQKTIIFMIILWVLFMMINENYAIVRKNAIFDTWNAVMLSIILISGIILMVKTIFK